MATMKGLSGRESFAHWCRRNGIGHETCAQLMRVGQTLHRLGVAEANGVGDDAAKVRAIKRAGDIVRLIGMVVSSSDGWITTRLHRPGKDSLMDGHALPRRS